VLKWFSRIQFEDAFGFMQIDCYNATSRKDAVRMAQIRLNSLEFNPRDVVSLSTHEILDGNNYRRDLFTIFHNGKVNWQIDTPKGLAWKGINNSKLFKDFRWKFYRGF